MNALLKFFLLTFAVTWTCFTAAVLPCADAHGGTAADRPADIAHEGPAHLRLS